MLYRKFSADYLFTGTKLLDNRYVLITDKKGVTVNIIEHSDAGDGIESFEGIISPGFINTHCHLELSHLQNKIPEKTGLTNFVYKVVTERHYPVEEIINAMETAQHKMIKNGIVAVGDICNKDLAVALKNEEQLQYYNFIEVTGWNPRLASERFEKSKAIYDNYITCGKKTSIVPHAPYSVSSPLWGKITPFFMGKTVTIHNQETIHEDEFFLRGTGDLVRMYDMMKIDNSFYKFPGTTSLQSYFRKMAPAASVILVHNTFIRQNDLDYINREKPAGQLVSFCLCPNANNYIENIFPPLSLLLENKVNIVLGTDSLASNHQLDILEEIKTISKEFPAISTETLLTCATLNGAKALQMENTLGSFEKGKKPGIVLIANTNRTRLTECSNAKRLL